MKRNVKKIWKNYIFQGLSQSVSGFLNILQKTAWFSLTEVIWLKWYTWLMSDVERRTLYLKVWKKALKLSPVCGSWDNFQYFIINCLENAKTLDIMMRFRNFAIFEVI